MWPGSPPCPPLLGLSWPPLGDSVDGTELTAEGAGLLIQACICIYGSVPRLQFGR